MKVALFLILWAYGCNEVNIDAFQAASSGLIDEYIKTYGGDWIKEIRASAQ